MEANLTMELREWYIKALKQFGWSKTELMAMITSEAHLEIVLNNEDEICDHNSIEKEISNCYLKTSVQFELDQFARRIVQQRCRGRP